MYPPLCGCDREALARKDRHTHRKRGRQATQDLPKRGRERRRERERASVGEGERKRESERESESKQAAE